MNARAWLCNGCQSIWLCPSAELVPCPYCASTSFRAAVAVFPAAIGVDHAGPDPDWNAVALKAQMTPAEWDRVRADVGPAPYHVWSLTPHDWRWLRSLRIDGSC